MDTMHNIQYISSTSLELGLVTSSILQLSVNKNIVNYEVGLWPYEEGVLMISSESILDKYQSYIDEILELAAQTTIRNIISVGMEAEFNDILIRLYHQKFNMIIIPNSQNVDIERIKRNYDKTTVYIASPHQAWESFMGINTLVIVPVFRLSDNTLYMYSYPRRFMGSDVNQYSFCCMSVELLPIIQTLDYRFSPAAPELCELSHIEGKYFTRQLIF